LGYSVYDTDKPPYREDSTKHHNSDKQTQLVNI